MDRREDEEDGPTLSAAALAALAEFYEDRAAAEERFRVLAAEAEDVFAAGTAAVAPENWQLSQFWYDDDTAATLASTALRNTAAQDLIVCISSPTAFAKIKSLHPPNPVRLLEFDERFQIYGDDFSRYNYRTPLELPRSLAAHSARLLIVDPPYLSDECFSKTAETVRHLAAEGAKIIVCTGAVMASVVHRELGLRMCAYRPGHANKLSNEFRCYANFDDPVLGRDPDGGLAAASDPAAA